MANSDWASEAFGTIDKSTWTSKVAVARERRTADRRVTHDDNGFVWGPSELLIQLGATARRIDNIVSVLDRNAGNLNPGQYGQAASVLSECADTIRRALGIS